MTTNSNRFIASGNLVYECINGIGPVNKVIKFTRASDFYCHNTRYATHRNFMSGLNGLKIEGAKLWENLPSYIKERQTKISFKICLKKIWLTNM